MFFKRKLATPKKLQRTAEPSYLEEDTRDGGGGTETTTAKGLVVEFTEKK